MIVYYGSHKNINHIQFINNGKSDKTEVWKTLTTMTKHLSEDVFYHSSVRQHIHGNVDN